MPLKVRQVIFQGFMLYYGCHTGSDEKVFVMMSVVSHNLNTSVFQIKELRNRGDEAARIIIAHAQEGLEPPTNLRRDFEQFLMMVIISHL